MLIGLSLSHCVSDILNNLVDKNDVAFIIAGTRIQCQHDLDDVLDNYARWNWETNPELGRAIAREFYRDGKILQPSVLGYNAPHVAEGHWAKVSREVANDS